MPVDVVINGRALVKQLNGIPRYMAEIINELDKISGDGIKIEVVVPSGKNFKADYKNIIIRELSNTTGVIWDFKAENYAKQNNALYINMANSGSFYRNSIITIHDIIPLKIHDKNINFIRREKSRLYFWLAIKRAKKIVAVSEFTKNEIISYYSCDPEKICIIGNGWGHIQRREVDESIFLDFPEISGKEYYLSIVGMAPHKNFNWIIENANYNKENLFVIVGKNTYRGGGHFRDRIIFTGFQSDERVKALILHAKALIFPSFYEGFGIPPLEALALGTPAIVSDIPVMHEIFSDAVSYIDPYNAKISLDSINTAINQDKVNSVLEAHSWKNSALKWRELIRQYTGK